MRTTKSKKRPTLTRDPPDAAEVRALLDYDAANGFLVWRQTRRRVRVGDLAGTVDGKDPPVVCIRGWGYPVARIVWLHQTGSWPRGSIIHRDGDHHNNRMENLRDARDPADKGPRYVEAPNLYGALQLPSGRWRAQSYDPVRKTPANLGTYDTAEEASAVASAYRDSHQKETPE